MILPKALQDLIDEFMKYPGVGRKTAERYALFTLNNLSEESVDDFSDILKKAKTQIHNCPVCGHLTDEELCHVCQNPQRDKSIIMIVESPKDVFSIEKSKEYNGLYHVLNGVISPMDGVGPEDINLKTFWDRISNDQVKEVIIATSSTQEGETTSMYIKKVLENIPVTVSRIGYGVPVGLNLEYADEQTLSKAIENRKKM
jgi:recombination protein RecR